MGEWAKRRVGERWKKRFKPEVSQEDRRETRWRTTSASRVRASALPLAVSPIRPLADSFSPIPALSIIDASPRSRGLSHGLRARDLDYFSMGLFARVG
jgi:hypothetical protein